MTFAEFQEANEAFDRHRGSNQDWLARYQELGAESLQFKRHGLIAMVPRAFDRVTDERNLYLAFKHVREKGGKAPGLDGDTCQDYPDEWRYARWLRDMLRGCGAEEYEHGQTKIVRVPKASGKGTRPIHLHNLVDRVVQRGIVQVLGPLLDPQFHPGSLGYRPGLDRCHALALAETQMRAGRVVVVAEDIQDAFENVPQQRAVQILQKYLPLPSTGDSVEDDRAALQRLMSLVEKAIVKDDGDGLRQGGGLSPLMLNVYLNHLLDRPWEKADQSVPLIRYADDILLTCGSVDEASRAKQQLEAMITDAGMKLKKPSGRDTKNYDLGGGDTVGWLGFQIGFQSGQMDVRLMPDWQDDLSKDFALCRSVDPADDVTFLEDWILQMGPAYANEDVFGVYNWLNDTTTELGLSGMPSFDQFTELWATGNRRWQEIREAYAEHGPTMVSADRDDGEAADEIVDVDTTTTD